MIKSMLTQNTMRRPNRKGNILIMSSTGRLWKKSMIRNPRKILLPRMQNMQMIKSMLTQNTMRRPNRKGNILIMITGIRVAIVADPTITGICIHSGISDIASVIQCLDGTGLSDIHTITGVTIHTIMTGIILIHTMAMAHIIQDTGMVITAGIITTIIIITTITIHIASGEIIALLITLIIAVLRITLLLRGHAIQYILTGLYLPPEAVWLIQELLPTAGPGHRLIQPTAGPTHI